MVMTRAQRKSIGGGVGAPPGAAAVTASPTSKAGGKANGANGMVGGEAGLKGGKWNSFGARKKGLLSELWYQLFPVPLMVSSPLMSLLTVYAIDAYGGSMRAMGESLLSDPVEFAAKCWSWCNPWQGNAAAWHIPLIFIALQWVLFLIAPGHQTRVMGPSGVTAVYPANGFAAMFGTAGFYAGMHYLGYLDFFQFVKDQFAHHGEVTCALNVIGFAATILLYLRGVFMPYDGEGGKGDAKLDGPLRDMYWGVELHPLILGTRVKLLCCRVGMMYWTLMCVTAPIYSALNSPDGTPSNAVLASCAIQMVYNVKFFLWEDGYINSMDMAVDKAGFMICWGCLAYVPSVYTLVCYYLAKLAPSDDIVTVPVAVAMFALGIALTLLNYWVDVQRTRFRDTDGKGLIWGAKPVVLRAPYVTEDGKTRMSCLLCSGWWGVARDIRYTFEMGATLAWTIPALFTHFVPYYYAAFLTILLIHRGERHERRCAKKYGDVWKKYSEIVPGRWFPTAKSFAPKRVD